ncbi:hypothetical protein WJX72_001368 [[Myrmecia] bisecta]|uniref:UBX domain-containing protein n=1 Tax=[Myrmecia] bisecta TaxID=41462 RepID=A0AAW1PEP8_9CHLO
MATSYTVSCNGSRYVAKVGPMAPLSQIVEGVCQQLKPPLDPSSCQLLLNKKPLDLSTPVRFANLPRDAKLELNTGQVHVFTRDAAMAAEAAARGDTDLPPEFYEFTPDDYRTVVAGYAQKRAKEESGLRTAKLREAEERQKAAAFGPVAVRVHLANGLIIQASFQPLDTVAALQQLVERCLLPTKAKWYLYTTPPKQPLKEATVTLYSAGLVPAANVYFGCDSGGVAEPYLRPEVLAMLAEPPKREQTAAQGQAGDSRSEGGRGGDAAFRSSSTATDGGAKKVPKWMKLGK